MTDLNLSLWGAGCAVIVGIIGYNFWQEYKAKKNVERAFGQHHDDVLLQPKERTLASSTSMKSNDTKQNIAQRQEPSLNPQSDQHEQESQQDSQLGSQIARRNHSSTDSVAEQIVLPVDDFIDGVITMDFESPVRGDKIMSEIQSFRRVGNKSVHFVGINVEESARNKCEIISHANSYTKLLAGVQLVTRSNALNELEYSELVMKLRQIADNLNAHPDIPDMKHVIDAGRDLHVFVTEHDARLSVNVHSNGAPWGISTLLAALEKYGFDTRPDGHLVMSDGEGGALFTLSTNCGVSEQDTKRLTLLLDVPCVAPSRGGFNAMVSCAKLLADRLDGTLVDDGNAVLSEATLNEIQEQVDTFYNSMQAAEIPAGSTRALRIFS
ncbi:MAG: cell division protein [Solimicrobium sp.]|jgi:hypothetical protein|nr:cell division protein [Solimicrobium sp.]